jgi:hypothetical protein
VAALSMLRLGGPLVATLARVRRGGPVAATLPQLRRGGSLMAALALAASSILAPALTAQDAPDVRPILAARCFKCHGAEKQKGNLRLDRPEGVASVVDPLIPAASEILFRVSLPDGDLDGMPPDGRLPQSQIDLLSVWVAAGAPLTVDVVSEEQAAHAAEAYAALGARTGTRVVAFPEGGVRVDFGRTGTARGMRPGATGLQAPDPARVVSAGDLSELAGLPGEVLELSLAGRVFDARDLPELPKLQHLRLARSSVSDAAVARLLFQVPGLSRLDLASTDVTDRVLTLLQEHGPLRRLVLFDTAVTDAALTAFAAARPDVDVTGAEVLPERGLAADGPPGVLVMDAGAGRVFVAREVVMGQLDVVWEQDLNRELPGDISLLPSANDPDPWPEHLPEGCCGVEKPHDHERMTLSDEEAEHLGVVGPYGAWRLVDRWEAERQALIQAAQAVAEVKELPPDDEGESETTTDDPAGDDDG